MARRYISTTQFNPYTFEEMWKPAAEATQMHMQQAQALAQLNAQAATIGAYINPEKDGKMYQAWNNYMNSIKQSSDALFTQGFSSSRFNDAMNLTVDYAQNIKPIENAINTKQNYAAMWADVKSKNPDLAMLGTPDDISLEEYMKGMPAVEYVSGNTVQDQVALLANAVYGKNVGRPELEAYNKFYDVLTQQEGLNADQIQALLQNKESGLNAIINYVLKSNRYNDISNEADKERILDRAKMGAYQGASGRKVQGLQESQYWKQMNYNLQAGHLQLSRDQFEFNKQRAAKQDDANLLKAYAYYAKATGQVPNSASNSPLGATRYVTSGASLNTSSNGTALYMNINDNDAKNVYNAVRTLSNRYPNDIGVINNANTKRQKIKKVDVMSVGDPSKISSANLILDPSFNPNGFTFKVDIPSANDNEMAKTIYYNVSPKVFGISEKEFADKVNTKEAIDMYNNAVSQLIYNSNSASQWFGKSGQKVAASSGYEDDYDLDF